MKKIKKIKSRTVSEQTRDGILYVHPKGFGFVSPLDSKKYPDDIFIPKHMKENAVDGDTVQVKILPARQPKKGPEGCVIKILKRGRSELVGTIYSITKEENYELYVPSLGSLKPALVLKQTSKNYDIGDRFLLHVKEWGEEGKPVLCEILEKIGSINDASSDILVAIKDFKIRDTFPPNALQAAESVPKEVEKKDLLNRTDLTHLESFTIDPDTAKDFDDALSLSIDEKGNYQLGIHIADVSHYVTPGSTIDEEARKRYNSTYFPRYCVPMLPEALSNHLCSLRPDVIRLTASVLVTLDSDGNVLESQILKGFIRSRKRFTYQEAKDVLDKKSNSPHLEALELMQKLCLILKAKRNARGSVDLALPELTLLIDEKGNPYDYTVSEYDITHQLVEEYMLKANEIVAKHFTHKKLPAVFRVHEVPDKENLEGFYALARSMGFQLPGQPKNQDIQNLFKKSKGTPYLEQLSIAFVRSMKLATYSRENIGHYGLALEDYCHFTSPIRRYSDLIIHRLLFDANLPENIEKMAAECSKQERISSKAEGSVVFLKKLRLLKTYHDKNPKRVYQATLSKIKQFGIFFEVSPLSIEGFLPLSQLHGDYYYFQPKTQSLIGKHSGRLYRVGNPVEVTLEEINLIFATSKWNILEKATKKKK